MGEAPYPELFLFPRFARKNIDEKHRVIGKLGIMFQTDGVWSQGASFKHAIPSLNKIFSSETILYLTWFFVPGGNIDRDRNTHTKKSAS